MRSVAAILELVMLAPFLLLALVSRYAKRPYDIGLGPRPLVNNVHHKLALVRKGFRAETFVNELYYVTDDFDHILQWPRPLSYFARPALFIRALFRYRCLYLYFDGGPLGGTVLLWRFEPLFYTLAGISVVVMPYGSDVQDLSRCPNLLLKAALSQDYPSQRRMRRRVAAQIDLWTAYADHVVSGCDWVDYMHHWDTLTLGHFSLDTDVWRPPQELGTGRGGDQPLRVLHAPNHRTIKGTRYLTEAVEELHREGCKIDLRILERVSNEEVREAIADADVVADQFVIGWYAMFALEGMAMGRPTLCYVREDLEEFYENAGILRPRELPLVRCTPGTVKERLRELYDDRELLGELGARSRRFVVEHHSLDAVGRRFAEINSSIGLEPRGTPSASSAHHHEGPRTGD